MTWDEGLDTMGAALADAARAEELVRTRAFGNGDAVRVAQLLGEFRLMRRPAALTAAPRRAMPASWTLRGAA